MVENTKILDALKTIGLNLYERKLYLALLGFGTATAGELAEASKVPRSRVYDVLKSLEDKGFVLIQSGRPVKFVAIEPREALQRWKKRYEEKIREMEKRIDNLLNSDVIKEMEKIWKKGYKTIETSEITGTLKGKNLFFDQIEYILKNSKNKVEILAPSQMLREIYENFAKLLVQAKERQVEFKFVATDVEDPEVLKILSQIGEVKVAEKEKIPISGALMIFDDEHVIMSVTDIKEGELTSIWSKSDYMAKNVIKPIFEIIWNNSKSL